MSVKSAEKRLEDEDRTPLQTDIHKLTGFGLATVKVSLCVWGGGSTRSYSAIKAREKTTLESHTV